MESKLKIKACAKINLSFDIVGNTGGGYHLIRSVMQSVDLCDTVTLSLTGSGMVEITCSDKTIAPKDNLAFRAAVAVLERAGLSHVGVEIGLIKAIPSRAGLGGGSADAAAVIRGLCRLLEFDLSTGELIQLGLSLGADVPFCLFGGTKLVEGIGEKLSDLPTLPDCSFVIAQEFGSGVDTKEAFLRYDMQKGLLPSAHTVGMIEAFGQGDLHGVGQKIGNVLWQSMVDKKIGGLIGEIKACGALGAGMTGSGSAVFGLFDRDDLAKACVSRLSRCGFAVFAKPTAASYQLGHRTKNA